MNERFFLLPAERQQRIINAAYEIFAAHDYKKAPMSEIAGAGNISKALLFHYFGSKRELYLYLWNHSIAAVRASMREFHVLETNRFFELIRRSLLAKCSLLQAYPHLYLFSLRAYYEREPEIRAAIHASFQSLNDFSEEIIWRVVDRSELRQGIDVKLLYQEIVWISDGYIRQKLSCGTLDPIQMKTDFMRMIEQWETVYLA